MFYAADISKDKNLYAIDQLALVAVYDDNWFVRNEYDFLSVGQRRYLISYFSQQGFTLQSGKLLVRQSLKVHLPRPGRLLAISNFQDDYLVNKKGRYYCVTPTTFAEALFRLYQGDADTQINAVKALIDSCPYNIEWLRDVSVNTDVEQITAASFDELMAYQKSVVDKKFKYKKSL